MPPDLSHLTSALFLLIMVSRIPGELRFLNCDLASNNEITAAFIFGDQDCQILRWPVCHIRLCFRVERGEHNGSATFVEAGPVAAFVIL